MPTPTVSAPPKERALPANLDELVRRAMSGQGVGELKKALAQSGQQPTPLPQTPSFEAPKPPERVAAAPQSPAATFDASLSISVAMPAAARPAATPPVPSPIAASSVAESPDAALVALVTAASRALAARAAGNSVELVAALNEATTKIETVRLALGVQAMMPETESARLDHLAEIKPDEPSLVHQPDEPVERTVRLPPIRHPFALILGAAPAGSELGALAQALGVDLATARNVALATGTRITLRGGDRDELERRAASARLLGVPAVVGARDQLHQLGPAWAVVGFDSSDRWRLSASDIWVDPPDIQNLPRGEAYALLAPRVVVVGEVEVRRLRAEATESKWQRKHLGPAKGAGGETRMAVLDVVFPERVLRLVEGAFDIRGFTAGDPTSARRSMKAVQEWLSQQFPSVRVEPRRICPAAPIAGNAAREDGWAAWEEHSRACALLPD